MRRKHLLHTLPKGCNTVALPTHRGRAVLLKNGRTSSLERLRISFLIENTCVPAHAVRLPSVNVELSIALCQPKRKHCVAEGKKWSVISMER